MKILLADDHRILLQGIERSLATQSDMEIVGEARSGSQVLPLVNRLGPDVLLLDIHMPDMNGITCLEHLRKRYPKVKTVVLSVSSDQEQIEAALERGAVGYIVKTINPAELADAVRRAVAGTLEPPRADRRESEEPREDGGLTDRETAILRAIASGRSNRAIGAELWVTEATVKFHLTNIYKKLGVANRTEAARHAYRLGLTPTPVLEAS